MVLDRPLRFTFTLSDAEFRRAWLREYYRRPGWRGLRIFGGPAFIALGVLMARGDDLFTRAMGIVTVLFGFYYAFKPLLAASALTRRRHAAGHHLRELTVTVGGDGIGIDDGKVRTQLPWAEVKSAGEAPDYVWYELQGGNRATIPSRAIPDRAALIELLREHTRWTS